MTKQNRTSNLSFLFLALVILLCMNWIWQLNGKENRVSYAELRQQFQQENVESFRFIDQHTLEATLYREVGGSKSVRYQVYDFDVFYRDFHELVEEQSFKGVIKDYDYPPPETTNWLELLLPWVLTAVVLGLMWYFFMARAQGGMGPDRMAKFGAARTRGLSEKDKKVTFDDVAGADEEKEELQEIV